jgi:hypothetical protein
MVPFMAAIGLSTSAPSSAAAQTSSPLRVGAYVSVAVPDTTCRRPWRVCSGGGVGGTLERATADTVVLRVGPTAVFAMPRLGNHVYVRRAGSRGVSALRWSLVAGLATVGLLTQTDASRGSVVQTSLGMAASGLVVGALRPDARWTRVAP